MACQFIDSPIGTLLLESDGKALTRVELVQKKAVDTADTITLKAAKELSVYFAGKADTFSVPTDAVGTAFQKAVWNVMKNTPVGTTRTYGEVAKIIGKPKAVRAVGTACGANPLLVVVPCHRIKAAHGLGGFAAGLSSKKWLLAREGVHA